MKNIFESFKKTAKRIAKPYFLAINKQIKTKKCYICGEQFRYFYKFRTDNKNKKITKYLQMVDSDMENFGCHYCYCNDRDRHLFMFFDKLSFWDKFENAKILHFAPENPLTRKIGQLAPKEYIKCDLFPRQDDWKKIDITKIDFKDDHFDILICNHVLEHVPDYVQALEEISRVLKKGGIAILQTPYSELLYNHFEDRNINTDELRLLFYGQEDHVRVVSKRQFFDELSKYFSLNIIQNKSVFSDNECFTYGVNSKENLIMVINDKK